MWTRRTRTPEDERIVVSDRIMSRVRLVPAGHERTWIEGALGEVGRNVQHHRAGDPLLDEAIMNAEAVLALLHEMRRRE